MTYRPNYTKIGDLSFPKEVVTEFREDLKQRGWNDVIPFFRDWVAAVATTGWFLWHKEDGTYEMRRIEYRPPVVWKHGMDYQEMRPFHRSVPIAPPDMQVAFDSVWIQAGWKFRKDFVRDQFAGMVATKVYPIVKRVFMWDIPNKGVIE